MVFALSLSPSPASAAYCGPTPFDCALYYVGRRGFSSAIRYLEQTLKRSPRDHKALNLMGIAFTASGEIQEANQQFNKALRVNPGFWPALKNLAINELTLKQTAQGKDDFTKYLKYDPQDEVANLSLAEIAFEENQCETALEHYEKSRTRIVNDTVLILHDAQCSLEQGRR